MKRFGLVLALGLALGCLGGCKGKELENLEIVDGHEMINQEILINETNFPDETFRKYVGEKFDKDANGRLSSDERTALSEVYISDSGIKDLKGIECLPRVVRLIVSDNRLTELDLSQNDGLTMLMCSGNQLTKLILPEMCRMNVLRCEDNQLTELDFSGCRELTDLYCTNNQLTELDLSNCIYEVKVEADEGVNIVRPTKAEE